jgi:hypothetical protein
MAEVHPRHSLLWLPDKQWNQKLLGVKRHTRLSTLVGPHYSKQLVAAMLRLNMDYMLDNHLVTEKGLRKEMKRLKRERSLH